MLIKGYLRVSCTEQAEDGRTSLQAQEQAIRGLAMAHGATSLEMYSDPGVSGSIPLAERPAGSRLTAALEPGIVVVASKLDRIFRSASDALNTVERWKRQGVDLILIDCGFEPVSANGNSKLFFSILASVAEFEKGRIAERMKDGRQGKKARGGHIGGEPPYGFSKVGQGRSAMLELNPAEQQKIRRIKELHAQGVTLRKLSDLLAAEGIVRRTGNPFSAPELMRIVNPGRKPKKRTRK